MGTNMDNGANPMPQHEEAAQMLVRKFGRTLRFNNGLEYSFTPAQFAALIAELRRQAEVSPNMILVADNNRMRAAGLNLAECALRVVREADGLHRLSLAVAEWSKAIADEGGRARLEEGK